MATAEVRAATAADVDEIIRIQASTWRTAYLDLVGEAAIERLSGPAARSAWQAAVGGDEGHVIVATEGDRTVGFCAAASGEVGTLLVEPRWGRRGHGGRLLVAAAEALRRDGAEAAAVWVAEADVASQRFYTRAGWQADGTVRVLDAGDRELREIRLSAAL